MPGASPPDPNLLDYCLNDYQRLVLQTYIEEGTAAKTAKALNLSSPTAVTKIRTRVEGYAASKGYTATEDLSRFVRPNHFVKGESLLLDGDGALKLRWLKNDTELQKQMEVIEETIANLTRTITPFKKVPTPKAKLAELCTVYTITDYHIGCMSWAKETGNDWDVDIAERILLTAISEMMDGSPDSGQAVFCQLGDFLHFDGLLPVTPTAKNVLDADTRYSKLVDVAVRVCVKAVEMMLHKHKSVHVVMAEGNHDLIGSIWLQAIMRMAFKDNPRVTIDDSRFPYYSFSWGKVFLGWHHGHMSKIPKMASKFFSEPRFRKQMADALWIYLATGHHHTKEVREESGAVIERHPTLSARDAHAARGFDHSQRGALAITYHKAKGETGRTTVIPEFDLEREI